jgi:FAD/FMN-containing dehydrogenase
MKSIETADIHAFRQHLAGLVLLEGEEGYEETRQVWNAMIDRKPALIAQCMTAEDVVMCVEFATSHQLLVSIRGGGHHIAGYAVCDDGLMIDLSLMKGVRVDPDQQRAWVEPGCTLADFDAAAQVHGLATPLGINSTTGVAGLTLGGGFGWLSRKYGMTIDNLLSAEVVTADGRLWHASETESQDLFWGLRGGGGNFGIVTSFEFELHPVGPDVLCGLIVFPFDQAKAVLSEFARFSQTMPDDLNVWVVARKAPPLPFLSENVHGAEVVVLALVHLGDASEGETLITQLRSFGTPHGEHIGQQPYTVWQQTFDPLLGRGARNYWKSHNFQQLSDGAIDAIIAFAVRLPSPQCEIFIGTVGGQTCRVAPEAMAYASRATNYVINVHGRWESADQDESCIAWAREFCEQTKPFASGGAYINFLTQEEGDRVAFAYGANYARLVELKQTYDPGNVFRMNQNIAPS